MGLNIGEASNPGPTAFSKFPKPDDLFYIESVNATNLGTNMAAVMEKRVGIQFIQEHSIPPNRQWIAKKILKACGKQAALSKLDTYADHNLGGVATITSSNKALGVVAGTSKEYRNAKETGRCDITVTAINTAMQLAVGNIYGYTGGNTNKKQMAKTNKLFNAVAQELDSLEGKYKMLVGDFNADISKIAACRDLMNRGWVDIGSVANIWGKPCYEPTCLTANARKGSRIDYILASPEVFSLIRSFEINHDNGMPNHATLRIGLIPTCGQQTRRCIQQPKPMMESLKERFQALHPA